MSIRGEREARRLFGVEGEENGPLFFSRYENRLKALDVARICARIANQANAHQPVEEHIKLTPHMLRHTFLKRVADQNGVHVAQQIVGTFLCAKFFGIPSPAPKKWKIALKMFSNAGRSNRQGHEEIENLRIMQKTIRMRRRN